MNELSSDDDDYPEWFKKRRNSKDPFFGDIDALFNEMEKMMENELKNSLKKFRRITLKNASFLMAVQLKNSVPLFMATA